MSSLAIVTCLPACSLLRLLAVYFNYLQCTMATCILLQLLYLQSTMATQLQSTVVTCSLLWLPVCYLARCLQPVYTQSDMLLSLQLQPFMLLSLSIACHATWACVDSLSCYTYTVYSLPCYLACLQPVMLLTLSIAYHATYTVYSLSCYLACLQPVMLLALSIACHATCTVYSLSCYLHCLQPVMLLSLFGFLSLLQPCMPAW